MVLQRSTPLGQSILSASTPAIPTSVPSAHSVARPKSLIRPTDTDPGRHSKHIDSRASSGGLAQRNFKQGAIGYTRICGSFDMAPCLKSSALCRMRHSRHTYATEMLRSGVSVPALMKLLGHKSPEMTMLYVEVTLTDLQREFQRALSQPRHLVPTPRMSALSARPGRDGVVDSLLVAQQALEMFRRALPDGASRRCLDRLSNRLTKIISEARKLDP
jgi:hypothetical protein